MFTASYFENPVEDSVHSGYGHIARNRGGGGIPQKGFQRAPKGGKKKNQKKKKKIFSLT